MMILVVLLLILLNGLLVLYVRDVGWSMRFGTVPFCLDLLVFGVRSGFQIPATAICADDIALWPYTPGLLVKWLSFLNSLHWPVGDLDLGVGGVFLCEVAYLK